AGIKDHERTDRPPRLQPAPIGTRPARGEPVEPRGPPLVLRQAQDERWQPPCGGDRFHPRGPCSARRRRERAARALFLGGLRSVLLQGAAVAEHRSLSRRTRYGG